MDAMDIVSSAAIGFAAVSVAGIFGFIWLNKRAASAYKLKAIVDLDAQTRILEDGSRVAACLKGDALIPYLYDDAKTISEAVRRGLRESIDGNMVGFRKQMPDGSCPYVWITYAEILKRAEDVAYALREIGIPPGQISFTGILSKNRPEWIVFEQATYNNNSILVPLYETLGPDACRFIINQTELKLVVIDEEVKAERILKDAANCPSLKHIIMIGSYSEALMHQAKEAKIALLSFAEFEKLGRLAEKRPEFELPSPEDLCTVAYTSGTTGDPKGVMLTHGNVIACTTGLDFFKNTPFTPKEVMFSFLPLAHMFERLLETAAFMNGLKVGYYSGDVRKLVDDIKELRPTVLPVVPRVLNRLHDKVIAEVSKSPLKKLLFDLALATKIRSVRRGVIEKDTLFDKVIFKKIRESLGGRVKVMITGSAPLAANVLEFTRAAMGCIVVEGYGQTECVAECTVSVEADCSAGCVGIPVFCNAIKLVDVPEFGYFAKDQAGEVCIKGYNVFKGYYKNERLTRETLDEDGWLHTGDIGRWTDEGTLKLIDRKKNIFKLAQGEYVAPEKIEAIYARSKYVAQVFVYGQSLKTWVIAVVVPDPEAVEGLAKAAAPPGTSLDELCKNPMFKKAIHADMLEVGRQAGLFSFEQAKDIYLCAEPFSTDNNMLTPTMKNRRNSLTQRFSRQLAEMYSKLE